MARMDMSGLDEVARDMLRLGQESDKASKAMLQAGAEKVKAAWRESIESHGLVKTGDMLDSVGYKPPKSSGTAASVDIYPQGTDRKGVSNAEKAFINHYGTSRRPGTRFVDEAEARANTTAIPAMEEVWDEFIKTGNVPAVPKTPNHPSGISNKG